MGDDKIRMPSGMGGLTQYHEAHISDWVLKPGYVIIIAVVVALIVLFLHVYGASIFGV